MTTLNLQVGANDDDAEENLASGAIALAGTILNLGEADGITPQACGVRFTGVTGLSGRIIDSATLTFRSLSTDSTTFEGDWFAEDAAAPGIFTSTNSDITDRVRTTATTEGDGSDFGNWTSGADETFDGPAGGIASIIQELADSFDPSEIVLIHIHTGAANGQRKAVTHNNNPGTATKLDIDHSATPTGGGPNQRLLKGVGA